MISNYIKLAIRVLARKKFFSFISLFGISFTLGILMVVLSFLQSELGSNTPLSNKDDLLILENLALQRIYYDTIPAIDTVIHNGTTVYDTTFEYKRAGRMMWNSEMNNLIGEQHLSNIPSVDLQTIFTTGNSHDLYLNGIKLSLGAMYADANYWKIFDHKLVEGRFFDQNDFDQALQVIVISDKIAQEYFDRSNGVVGEEMEIEKKTYKVIGVYIHNGKIIPFVSPDAVLPYSLLDANIQPTYYHGFYSMVFKKKKAVDHRRVKSEIDEAAKKIPLDHPSKPEGYNEVVLDPVSYDEMYAKGVYYDEDEEKSLTIMKWILLSLLGFFILLPTLNLINLNVSRIMDRSTEIGVRKAFGAHGGNILWQFIIENIVQTIIGGIIGLALALLLINLINKGGALGDATLALNAKFFIYSFIATLIFGIISGFIPAYKMSKLHIVNALKENKL